MKKAKKPSPPLLAYQAEEALRKAVAEAIVEHRRNGSQLPSGVTAR